jgi:hypothetical protein
MNRARTGRRLLLSEKFGPSPGMGWGDQFVQYRSPTAARWAMLQARDSAIEMEGGGAAGERSAHAHRPETARLPE